jgi:two-component system, chemotaxis family, protein-glutamate methylesterase/glutaminase
VQDPDDALYSGMPASALAHLTVDAVAPIDLVADAIAALVMGRELPEGVGPSRPDLDLEGTESELVTICPECGGVLTERDQAGMLRWRCHVGHLYSPRSLCEAQGAAVEAALWTALRTLEDRGALLRRMAAQAERRAQLRSAGMFRAQSARAQEQAELVRDLLRGEASAAQRAVGESETDEAMPAGGHA